MAKYSVVVLRYLLLFAMATITLSAMACKGGRQQGQPPPTSQLGPGMHLSNFTMVEGTEVFRATLVGDGGSLSGGRHTRNIAFLEPTGSLRWLLPDSKHTLTEWSVRAKNPDSRSEEQSPIALIVLAKVIDTNALSGSLLILDPVGHKVSSIAESVTDVLGVGLTDPNRIVIIYETSNGYTRAVYEADSLAKIEDVRVIVPSIS